MWKIIPCIIVILAFVAGPAAVVQAGSPDTGTKFIGKMGTAYASVADKYGFELNLSIMSIVDPYFALGFELGYFNIGWSQKLGERDIGGGLTESVTANTSGNMLPVYFNMQIRIPDLLGGGGVSLIPTLTVGLGYCFLFAGYSQPSFTDIVPEPDVTYEEEDKSDFYSGFTWQSYLTIMFRPPKSSIYFLLDVGYRAANPARKNAEINLSGIVLRFGVQFNM